MPARACKAQDGSSQGRCVYGTPGVPVHRGHKGLHLVPAAVPEGVPMLPCPASFPTLLIPFAILLLIILSQAEYQEWMSSSTQ